MKRALQFLIVLLTLVVWPSGKTILTAGVLDASGNPDPAWQNNALLLWLKADAGVTKDGSNKVSAWADQSTYGYVATQGTATYQPQFNSTGLNGQPTIALPGSGQHMLIASGPVGQQTLLIVYQDTSTKTWVTPVGTAYNGKGSYHGHSDGSQLFNTSYTDPATINGGNYRNGVDIGKGLTTPRPGSWALDVHVATAALTQAVTTIGADHNFGTSREISGGIAEILLYDRALDLAEINQVGHYLEQKYGLATNYAYVSPSAVADSATEFSGTQGTMNWRHGKYDSLTGRTFSTSTTYSLTPSGLLGNPGPHWSESGSYPKLWDAGVHPGPANPAVRRWTSEAAGVAKITGQLAKFDTAGGDGVRGDIRVNGAAVLSQTIAANDAAGVNYTVFARVQNSEPVDFVVNPLGNHNNDSTRFTATVEMVDPNLVVDLADIVGGGDGHGTGTYPGGYNASTGAFVTTVGTGPMAPAGFKTVSPANDLIDGVFIARQTSQGVTQITSTGLSATIPGVTANGAYFHIRDFLGSAGDNRSTLDGVDFNNVGGHRMIAVHPNQGITFDLDAIEHDNGALAEFFSAVAGVSTTNSSAQSSFGIYVDGELRYQHTVASASEIGMAFPINLPLNPGDRFLTLVAMDYNGLASDGVLFGDPMVLLRTPEPNTVCLAALAAVLLVGLRRHHRER